MQRPVSFVGKRNFAVRIASHDNILASSCHCETTSHRVSHYHAIAAALARGSFRCDDPVRNEPRFDD
jgi:hypothetical protein